MADKIAETRAAVEGFPTPRQAADLAAAVRELVLEVLDCGDV